MRNLSPFNSRYGVTPFLGSSFSNFEEELEKLFGSLLSLFDVGGDWISDSGSRSARPSWFEHDDAYGCLSKSATIWFGYLQSENRSPRKSKVRFRTARYSWFQMESTLPRAEPSSKMAS